MKKLMLIFSLVFLNGFLLYGQTDKNRTVILSEGFEDGTFKSMGTELGHDYSAVVVSDTARSGKHSIRFTLTRDDKFVASSKRAELTKSGDVSMFEETWTGHSVLLPKGYENDPNFEIIYQWHERPDWSRGEDWRSPPVSMSLRDDTWYVGNRWDPKPTTVKNDPRPEGGTDSWAIGKAEKGVWTDFVVRTFWSHRNDGILQVWKNGELVVNKRGPVMYNDLRGPYYKIGIYKPPFKHGPHNHVQKRTFYVDDISITRASGKVTVLQTQGPRLEKIQVGGKKLEDFDPLKIAYEIELPAGAPEPKIKAVASGKRAKINIKRQDVAAGSYVITVTDNDRRLDYVVTFLNPSPQLKSVTVNDKPLETFDPEVTAYDIDYYDGKPLPAVKAVADNADTKLEQGKVKNGNVWIKVTRGKEEQTYWFIFHRRKQVK